MIIHICILLCSILASSYWDQKNTIIRLCFKIRVRFCRIRLAKRQIRSYLVEPYWVKYIYFIFLNKHYWNFVLNRRSVDDGEEKPGRVLETPEPRTGKEHNGPDGPFGSNNHVENVGQTGSFPPGNSGPPNGNAGGPTGNYGPNVSPVLPAIGNLPNKIQVGKIQDLKN